MSETENADSTQYTEEARTMTWLRPYYMIFSTGSGLLRSNNRAIGKFRIDTDTRCHGKMELGLIKIDTDSKLSVGCNYNPYWASVRILITTRSLEGSVRIIIMTGDDKNPVLARFHGVDWIGLELSGVELELTDWVDTCLDILYIEIPRSFIALMQWSGMGLDPDIISFSTRVK